SRCTTSPTIKSREPPPWAKLDWIGSLVASPSIPRPARWGGSSQVAQLVQAMAGFGGGSGATESLNSVPLSGDTSRPSLLTTPQHTYGHLEKFLSPTPHESDSVTARGNGRMERAGHGAKRFFRC